MANFDGQSTDSQNSAPLKSSSPVEDDVRVVSQKSAQKIAQERTNLGGVDATGNEDPVTAKVSAGK
jgi:hypothetical protein